MAALKLLNLIALAAIFALSSAPLPANALVADRAQVARHIRGHDAFAKRKRSDTSTTGLCKPRPSTTDYTPTSTPAPAPTTQDNNTPSPAPAPTSSSSSATPSPTPSSSVSSSGRKWGLAWGADDSLLSNFDRPNVGFVYNWSPEKPSTLGSTDLQFIPMLWGYDQISSFQQLVVPGYAEFVLGFNEPNQDNESNMSPQDAYNLWMQYINPLKAHGYKLISPACTNDASGLQWYQQFFQLCRADSTCQVDYVAFHAYTTDPNYTIDYATWLYTNYSLPVMITEFADENFTGSGPQPTMDQVWAYAAVVSEFVNSTPWLAAAFPFGVMSDLQGVDTYNALLGSNGYPTSLGYYYFG